MQCLRELLHPLEDIIHNTCNLAYVKEDAVLVHLEQDACSFTQIQNIRNKRR